MMMNKMIVCLVGIVLVIGTSVVQTGCGTVAVDADTDSTPTPTPADMRDFARHYLYDEVSQDEAGKVLEEVQNLSPSDAQAFSQALRELQGNAQQVNAAEALDLRALLDVQESLDAYAEQMDVNRFAYAGDRTFFEDAVGVTLSQDRTLNVPTGNDSDIGLTVQALCSPGYVSCNWTNYWPATLSSLACTSGCTSNGIWSDRMSNSACEFAACDHRIAYTIASQPHKVSGLTIAAQCIVNFYSPNILSAYTTGVAYALFGIQGPAACGLYSSVTWYLQTYTKVSL